MYNFKEQRASIHTWSITDKKIESVLSFVRGNRPVGEMERFYIPKHFFLYLGDLTVLFNCMSIVVFTIR